MCDKADVREGIEYMYDLGVADRAEVSRRKLRKDVVDLVLKFLVFGMSECEAEAYLNGFMSKDPL